ncbi:hypothetical protein N9Q11_01125 [Acidimicrobiia bacterium]|jgi:hypothetical protein|nr:hypothetical protein [Acidimicrobiia bacterium]MDC1070941.1 hypothetical protein [Acidimicrobiia bacterium]|tara:strand:+ start:2736 stop:2936 length:201 start_codon:yes stop_codon:yes gene_type:complete
MKKIIKLATFVIVVKALLDLFNENTTVKNQIDRLKEEITKLETDDLESKIKDFFKKYDPKKYNDDI